MDQNCRAMYTHECRLIPHNFWDKSEWTRTVALCTHMNVGYSFVISEIIKSEWTRTVALCIHMTVGFFFVRLNARGKKRVCTQQVMKTETAETQVFEFLTTRQNFLLSCQSDVAVRKVTSTPEICRQAASPVHYTTCCKHCLVLLRMGEIIARNRLSWLKLLINSYCCN